MEGMKGDIIVSDDNTDESLKHVHLGDGEEERAKGIDGGFDVPIVTVEPLGATVTSPKIVHKELSTNQFGREISKIWSMIVLSLAL